MTTRVYLKESTDETLTFGVISTSRQDQEHIVYYDKDNGWVCTCEQYYYRKKRCKHMKLAQDYFLNFYNSMKVNNKVFHEKK